MASEEQSNIQKDLNDLVKEYKSDLLEASEFIAILTSRTSDLANQSKILVKNNYDFKYLIEVYHVDVISKFKL
jgi:predicted S18 family serine protease